MPLMAKENWVEVRLLVPLEWQEEAAYYLTEFTGRGVILEEESAPAAGAVACAASSSPGGSAP